MLTRSILGVAAAVLSVLAPAVRADENAKTPRQAIERGLAFLEADAAKWRKEKQCATCHHGTMTVWAYSEAKAQGYPVAEETVAETVKWTKERLKDIDKPRDTRPGWKMVNSPALVLANMALAIPKQDALSADELKRIAVHLLRHQEADGSWAWSSAPPANRAPPFFESDEVATLLATQAIGTFAPTDPKDQAAVRESRARAAAWLAKTPPNDTTQAVALRLLGKVRAGEPASVVQAGIDELSARQNKDGGWDQVKDRASDAHATGQSLYILTLAGVKSDRPEVRRGVAFLVATQNADGSWPMTRRSHPGVTPGNFTVPIVYFGSAWGTLGLLRAAPK